MSLARLVAETFNVTSVALVRREALCPLAVWSRGQAHEPPLPPPCGTLLEQVFARGLHHRASGADESRPEDNWPRQLGRCGFLGMALKNAGGEAIGVLALYDDGPLEVGPSDLALLEVFALRAGTALEQSREHPRALTRSFLLDLLDTLPVPILIKDRQHRYVLLNAAFCRFMGRDSESLLRKSDGDFMSPQEASIFLEQDEQAFRSNRAQGNEAAFTDRLTGEARTLFIQRTSFMGTDGHPRLVCVIRDITEYKHDVVRTADRLATVKKEEPPKENAAAFRRETIRQAAPFMRVEGHPSLVRVISDSTEYKHELARMADRLAALREIASVVLSEIASPLAVIPIHLRHLREEFERPGAMTRDLTELLQMVDHTREAAERIRAILNVLRDFLWKREHETREGEE
jgi:PAS domain S-box-containing protein